MSPELRLLPFDGETYSHTILNVQEYDDLFSRIQKIQEEYGVDVPTEFNSFCGSKGANTIYGRTTKDPYGAFVQYITAKSLKKLKIFPAAITHGNISVWAYLEHLPDGTKVALYWH